MRHLSMRSANPVLNSNTFKEQSVGGKSMTINGTVNCTAISLMLLSVSAYWSWGNNNSTFMIIGIIGSLILAIATVFKPQWAPMTVPAYSIVKGLLLGGISASFERIYPGIVSQAVFLTFGILASLLLAYKSNLIKASENFKLGIVAATGGIALVYIINLFMGFFGMSIPVIHSNSTWGILFSLGVCVIASLNLILDFDFIEQGAERGAPKYMEWYGAFGLMVTLIWLYIEILHLLSKLQSRR
jgi:uncharacterized YccA/Bax inhibitor family protein